MTHHTSESRPHQPAAPASHRTADSFDASSARILERIADEHMTLDAEFRILTMNASAERASGLARAAIIGRTHWEAFPESIGTTVEQQYRRAMAERVDVHFTHRNDSKGRERLLEIDAYHTDSGGLALFLREVTDRALAEQALKEMSARYRALFESIDTGFAILEVVHDDEGAAIDHRILEANTAFETHTGLRNPEGRLASELVPTLERFWSDRYGEVARSGKPMRLQSDSDALGRWFDVFVFPVGEPSENRVGLLFTDITAAKLAAEERELLVESLAVERARLEEVFRQAPAFLAVLHGPMHVFTLVNDAYRQMVGHRDLIGRPVMEALPEVREQGFAELLDSVLATGEPYVGRGVRVMLARKFDSPLEERFLDLTYLAMTEAGGDRVGIIAFGVDVTERVRASAEREQLLQESEIARRSAEESERRFWDTANAAPVLIWTSGPDGMVDWVNVPWLEFTERTMNDELGEGWLGRMHPGDREAYLNLYATRFIAQERISMEYRLLRHDNEYRWIMATGVPRFSNDGSFCGYIGTGFDITEQRLARDAAEAALAEAEAANRSKSEFLAVMSHELRTPLNAIDGYAELMELGIRGPTTEEQLHDLGRIRKSERHLLGLINGVLNFAQVESGHVHYEAEEVPLTELLAECEALTASQAGQKGLRLLREPCDKGIVARVDREKTQQIVINLLSNAIKFTDSGGVVRLVCLRERGTHGDWARVDVRDTGIGIPVDQLRRVFEPFIQIDSGLTRTREGTGLGLSISRDLAHGMGGELLVESEVGSGSCFTLRLPLAR